MQETELDWVCRWNGRDETLISFPGVNDPGKTEMEMEDDANEQK